MEKTNDQKLTRSYQKEAKFEQVLDSINSTLSQKQTEIYSDITDDQTTIHIIGAPRSGTTLLSQLILSTINVGYINNLIAAFWKAPLYGIHLSEKLLATDYKSSLESDYGRTKGIYEPHEFGYFWKHHLNYSEFLQQTNNASHHIDWENFKNILYQMVMAFKKPLLFKSFLYGFHIEDAVAKMPKTLYIHIKRDQYQNAYSILNLRKKMFGNEETWASMKPHQYEFLQHENIYRQLMGQVLFLNYEYEKQLANIPEANKLTLNYSEVCNDTQQIVQTVHEKINHLTETSLKSDMDVSNISENIVAIPEEILNELKKAETWLRTNYSELK